MKLCVIFPGIGYNCDKPLLYYCARLAKCKGYDVIRLKFSDFPDGAKGNEDKMRIAAAHAFLQSEKQLSGIDFSIYESVTFVGKSIGTYAAAKYAETYCNSARQIFLTPLEMTLEPKACCLAAFSATADQWVDIKKLKQLCEDKNIPLNLYPDANHSIETDDIFTSMKYLDDVMGKIDKKL